MYLDGAANLNAPTGALPYLIPKNSKVAVWSGARWPTISPLVEETHGLSICEPVHIDARAKNNETLLCSRNFMAATGMEVNGGQSGDASFCKDCTWVLQTRPCRRRPLTRIYQPHSSALQDRRGSKRKRLVLVVRLICCRSPNLAYARCGVVRSQHAAGETSAHCIR